MDGFININKPQGMTSFDVIRKLKRLFPKTKIGHLGTLDPMAQGVLPVAIGFATRLIEYVSDEGKEYQATMTLGGISDTQDAWGKIIYKSDIDYNMDNLSLIFDNFTGVIDQIPPMYSAVHYQGERLYELARKGITVERAARKVMIKSLNLLSTGYDLEGRLLIKIKVECSGGTYVRTLCHDIGQKIGTGAYLSELIRTKSGPFNIGSAVTLHDLMQNCNIDDHILDIDFPLMHLNRLTIRSALDLEKIINGNKIIIEEDCSPGIIRIYNAEDKLLSIARLSSEENHNILQPLKVFK